MRKKSWHGGAIVGVTGIYKGAVFKLAPNEVVVIGRDPAESNIVISEESTFVSRKHCSVKFDSSLGCYIICDYSQNGVKMDEKYKLVKGVETAAERGSIIEIGNADNTFKLI